MTRLRRLIASGSAAVAIVAGAAGVLHGQARDAVVAPRSTGTGTIAGIVMTDEDTPRPLRRATVMLASGDIRMPETTVTEDDGSFKFVALPAGNYTLVANRPTFVACFYGSKKPGKGPGVPIALAEGQTLGGLQLKLLRGSVITGVVRDQNGQPLASTAVMVAPVQIVNGQRRSTLSNGASTQGALTAISGVQTDDRGIYRAYGLAPGEYLVSVRVGSFASTEAQQITSADVRWAEQATSASATAAPGMTPPLPPAPPPGSSMTTAMIYYPGTPDAANAQPVTLGRGEERGGVDVQTSLVATAHISGMITDADGQPPNGTVSITPAQPDSSDLIGAILGAKNARIDADGKFSVTGVTPGRYKVVARGSVRRAGAPQQPANPMEMALAMLGGGGGGSAGPGNLWAMEEITVDGVDISSINLRLQAGMTVSGKVVYETATGKPPANAQPTRISLSQPSSDTSPMSMVTSMMNALNAAVEADGTFAFKGVTPDRYRANIAGAGMLGAMAGAMGGATPQLMTGNNGLSLKSIMLNGRDVSDAPFEVQPGRDVTGLVVTLTDRPTELSGRVIDKAGRPAPGFPIVVFSTDKTYWSAGSRRVLQVRPSSDGKYTVTALPPGEYYVAAVVDLDPGDLADPTFLEQLAASGAFKVTLGDGEKKTQDLRLAGG